MRYYEKLSPADRQRVVLSAVAFSSAMEGMDDSRDACLEALRALERKAAAAIPTPPADPAMPRSRRSGR